MIPYLLIWHAWKEGKSGSGLVNRQDILDALDRISEVANWRASTGGIFIVSASNAQELATKIHAALPYLIFVITPLRFNEIGGWSDKETWDFIERPKGSWENKH